MRSTIAKCARFQSSPLGSRCHDMGQDAGADHDQMEAASPSYGRRAIAQDVVSTIERERNDAPACRLGPDTF